MNWEEKKVAMISSDSDGRSRKELKKVGEWYIDGHTWREGKSEDGKGIYGKGNQKKKLHNEYVIVCACLLVVPALRKDSRSRNATQKMRWWWALAVLEANLQGANIKSCSRQEKLKTKACALEVYLLYSRLPRGRSVLAEWNFRVRVSTLTKIFWNTWEKFEKSTNP